MKADICLAILILIWDSQPQLWKKCSKHSLPQNTFRDHYEFVVFHIQEDKLLLTMSALSNMKFPESLFSNECINIEGYRCSDKQLDDQFHTYTYIDGFLAISSEAQLCFIKHPTRNVILEKQELAYWFRKEELKGVGIRVWDTGLPIIKVKYDSNLFLTFIPNIESELENFQMTLAASKRLYDAIMELIMPKVISQMPRSSFTRIMNAGEIACESYYIHSMDFEAFSAALLEELNQPQQDPRLAALNYCQLHFFMKDFGQNLPFEEISRRHFQSLVSVDHCLECLIHIATDIGHPDYSLLWARDFVQQVYSGNGNVYYACGFHSAANGDGRILNGCSGIDEIDRYVRLMKLYNTTFKRLPQTISQTIGLYFEKSFFSNPRIAKLLSLQHRGIDQYERRKFKKGKIVDALRQGAIFDIIVARLDLLTTTPELHKARLELIITLRELGAWEVIEANYVREQITHFLTCLYYGDLEMDNTPLYAIPREAFVEFLKSEITTLLGPIVAITEGFFNEKKTATPDELFTVYLAELVLDFIIHGTKNFLHALKSMGITEIKFRNLNRVSFFGIEFRRQGQCWLLDASCARPSNVYTLYFPEGPQDPEPLTDKLMRVHCSGKGMLNKYSIAMCLLAEIMEDIHRVNMRQLLYRRLNGRMNAHCIFGRAFTRHMTKQTPICVSQFVDQLQSGTENVLSKVPESIQLAEEVLGDVLGEDSGSDIARAQLKQGMSVVLNCALKGHFPVEIYAVPQWKKPGLPDTDHYSLLMPDLNDVLLQTEFPVFEESLLNKLLICVNRSMGELRPFPQGINSVQPWHLNLVYKVLSQNVRGATKAIELVGCAIVKNDQTPTIQRKLQKHMYRHCITNMQLRRYNLLAKDDSFTYRLERSVKAEEVVCRTVLNKLHSHMVSPF